MAYLSQSLNDDVRVACGWKRVPSASPASARATAEARRPEQIVVGIPAAVAISAAETFERMPPLPSVEVSWPMSSAPSSAGSRISPTRRASGSAAGFAVYSPSVLVSSTSRRAPSSTATCAARKSLSPNEISSVAVVSFSLMTGTTSQSMSRCSVWRALR